MSKQPKALEVADAIEKSGMNFYGESSLWYDDKLADATCDAMDLLRSQHALIAELVVALDAAVLYLTPRLEGTRGVGAALLPGLSAVLSKAKEQQ